MPTGLERKLPVILFLVLLIMAAIGYLSYRNTGELKAAVTAEKHTQAVVLNLDEALLAMVDIETGMRGFFVSADETLLEPYKRGKEKLPNNMERLRGLLQENPDQISRMDDLQAAIDIRIADADQKVETRRTVALEDAIEIFRASRGKAKMDSVRDIVATIRAEELKTLEAREAELDQNLTKTSRVLVGVGTAGILTLALANIVVFLEVKKRRKAEDDLKDANKGLERRVGERTAELAEANKNLGESLVRVSREISDRKKAEDEREQILLSEQAARREAEIANRLRDEFMASVSHELRTPLNSILGWARLLKGGMLDETISAKAVDTIIKSSETQNRLIEDLLDVARLISGKLEMDITRVNVVELISNSIEAVRPILDGKNISLNLEIDDAWRETEIPGNADRLQQVVWNLLTNAIKFSPEEGKVNIALSGNDDFVELEVSDNGIGISPEFLPFVFERFRQDTSNIEKRSGLGLGLAIVRHLVELHGGSVRAHSDGEGKGSVFTVSLPVGE